jgi:hypothetical protein
MGAFIYTAGKKKKILKLYIKKIKKLQTCFKKERKLKLGFGL